MSINPRTIAALLVLLILVGLPFGLGNYGYYILAIIMIYAIVALGLNVLIGMGGQISIGHAGFWALGAYASALSVIKLGLPFLLGVAVGGMVAASFGALVALPALRVQGHYLAIATLGFALVVQQVLFEFEWLTGGRQGLFVPRPSLFGIELASDFGYYYFLLAVFLLLAWVAGNFAKSHTGRSLMALRELNRSGVLRHSSPQAHHHRIRRQRVLHGRFGRAVRPSPGPSQHRDVLARRVPVVPDHGGDRRPAFARWRVAWGSVPCVGS